MPTLHGTMPHTTGPLRPCIWCKDPTDIRFVPDFRPDWGPQPLHMTCAMLMIRAWERRGRGGHLDGRTMQRLRLLAPSKEATR